MKISQEDKARWTVLLQGVRFFSVFTKADLDALLDIGEAIHVNLHEYVIREAEAEDDNSFYVVLKGAVKIIKQSVVMGKKNLIILRAGECFGEIAFLIKSKRTASVLAVEDCYIFKIKPESVSVMEMSIQLKMYQQFAIALAERLKFLTDDIMKY